MDVLYVQKGAEWMQALYPIVTHAYALSLLQIAYVQNASRETDPALQSGILKLLK
jgi:hypothetical protein